jgi:hypothetical protein
MTNVRPYACAGKRLRCLEKGIRDREFGECFFRNILQNEY